MYDDLLLLDLRKFAGGEPDTLALLRRVREKLASGNVFMVTRPVRDNHGNATEQIVSVIAPHLGADRHHAAWEVKGSK